ncbi:MAG: HAMP domain-containing protein, partial [Myxococcales bacterium]
MKTPPSLTGRLVATTVALVALVGLLVSVATALAMRSYLTDRLDQQLEQTLQREAGAFAGRRLCPTDLPSDLASGPRGLPPGQASGTLTVRSGCAFVVTDEGSVEPLSDEALQRLASVDTRVGVTTISVPGLGDYRVLGTSEVVTGLPTRDVGAAVRNLLLVEVALTLTGVLLAAMAGHSLVRRQLRPLRDVAAVAQEVTAQELDRGKPSLDSRVPAHLTDGQTEVGRVGAALNALLDHVDSALDARHASEQQVRQFVADASHELR